MLFSFVAEEIFELGYTTKSWCLENNIIENYCWKPVRVLNICSEMPSNSKECVSFVVDEFSCLWNTVKILNHGHRHRVVQKTTRYLAVKNSLIINFPKNYYYMKPPESVWVSWFLVRNTKWSHTVFWVYNSHARFFTQTIYLQSEILFPPNVPFKSTKDAWLMSRTTKEFPYLSGLYIELFTFASAWKHITQ